VSGRYRGIVFKAELDAKIAKIAKEMGVNHSAAVRMLCERALGQGMARLLVDEKVFEVKQLLAKRINQVVNEGLRQDLHALVDEVNPPTVSPLVDAREREEVVVEDDAPEPTVEAVRGRPRKAAKARRR
jgi:antitoxin component of RelBE/YafQ-DinJ toxin-antitoxin module